LLHTRHILHVKYWSLIFSARRSTCCVIFSDGVGVVLVDELFSGKWRWWLSSLFTVKVLNRSQTHAFSNNHLYFCLVAIRNIAFISLFLFLSLFNHLLVLFSFPFELTACSFYGDVYSDAGTLIYLTYDEMSVRICCYWKSLIIIRWIQPANTE
jgi:hypothetical protein